LPPKEANPGLWIRASVASRSYARKGGLETGSAQVPFLKEGHFTGQVLIPERIENVAGEAVAASIPRKSRCYFDFLARRSLLLIKVLRFQRVDTPRIHCR
jgi:hypothetical protein